MSSQFVRAWLAGATLLVAALFTWVLLLGLEVYSQPVVKVVWFAPGIAAFLAAYLGPTHKLLLGVSMAIPSALLVTIANFSFQALGKTVDFPGLGGGLMLFALVLCGSALLAAVGAAVGYILTRNRK
jgi:hypothetical protein